MNKILLMVLLLSAEMSFGQAATFVPVTVAFPQVVVGSNSDGTSYTTLLQVANNNSATTNASITLFSDSGAALSALFDGQGPQSSFSFSLDSGVARQLRITANGAVNIGWMQVNYTPAEAQTSMIIQFKSPGGLVTEVGESPKFLSPYFDDLLNGTDFPIETNTGANLDAGVALANPSSTAENLFVRIWNPSTGAMLSSANVALAANGHTAKKVTELFSTVAGITQVRALISVDSCANSTCTALNGPNGFIATVIRLNGNQFSTIPVQARSTSGATVRILPHVAFGGDPNGFNIQTVLYFSTISSSISGTANVFDDNGNPIAVSANGLASSSSFPFSLAGLSTSKIVLTGDSTLRAGWIQLSIPSGGSLLVNAIFQTSIGTSLISEASVLDSPLVTRGLVYVNAQASTSSDVGIAFANPQATPNPITVTLYNNAGFVFATKTITLPAFGHFAKFVTDPEMFPQVASLAGFDGALSVSSSVAFSALALRKSVGTVGADVFSSLPLGLNTMFRPTITGLQVTGTQRTTGQVTFSVQVTDYNNDISTLTATAVPATGSVDFGSNVGFDTEQVVLDGTSVANAVSGTLSGTFQSQYQNIPTGFAATFYIWIFDVQKNDSNIVSMPIKF